MKALIVSFLLLARSAWADTYHVTSLANAGAGTLREALSQGDRTVVFDVGGTIPLTADLDVKGANVVIAGETAPAPGITLTGMGINIDWVLNGATATTIRHLRIRNTAGDGIMVKNGANNVALDHCSVSNFGDGAIDVTNGALRVSIRYCLLAEGNPAHNLMSLLKGKVYALKVDHNLFFHGMERHPKNSWDSTLATFPPTRTLQFYNNVIWDFISYGTQIIDNAQANVLTNYYWSSTQPTANRALRINTGGRAYANGNVSRNGANVDGQGTETAPFGALPLDREFICAAVVNVKANAGALPHDSTDQAYLDQIQLPAGC